MSKLERSISEELALKTPPTTIPAWKSSLQIFLHSLKGSLRSFVISFLLRGGISFVIRIFTVLRKKSTIWNAIVGAVGTETVRFSTMIGVYSFLWKLISNLLHFHTKSFNKRNGAIAGAIAGLAVLIERPENRLVIAQQFFMRSMQAGKNALKHRNLFSFTHGDTVLFCAAVASIMYAYTMAPKTIPKEYYYWIIQHGRVPKVMVELNRSNTRAVQKGIRSVDLDQVEKAMDSVRAIPENRKRALEYIKMHGYMPHLPCACIHPKESSCSRYCISVWYKTFVDMLPVYLSLNGVPMVLFKLSSLVKDPLKALKRILKATLQSSTFLSTFISFFQTLICLHRKWLPTSHEKYLFYYMGAIAGLAILIEQKPKRAELAMYVLPKGLQSLYSLSIANGAMIRIPGLEVISTSIAMSIIMSMYQKEPYQLSSLMYKFLKSVIGTY